jgi:hypothetical protein
MPSSEAAWVVLAVEDMKDIESVTFGAKRDSFGRSRRLPRLPNEL